MELAPITTELLIEGFHSIYYFELDPHFYHLPEKHDFWEMVYVDDGRIRAITDGIGCTLQKGQVIFHKPRESHAHIANHKDASSLVVVSFTCRSPLMEQFNKKIFTLEKAPRTILSLFLKEAERALGKIPDEYENKAPLDFSGAALGSVQLMQCYLVEFLFSLLRSKEQAVPVRQTEAARRMAESTLADSVARYMEAHLEQPPSLETLCRRFSLSRAYLCRVFRAGVGGSPVDYWIRLKIKEAKRLLREGEYNITQIADRLGYASIHHFSRTFKRVAGVAPTAYQSRIKK